MGGAYGILLIIACRFKRENTTSIESSTIQVSDDIIMINMSLGDYLKEIGVLEKA